MKRTLPAVVLLLAASSASAQSPYGPLALTLPTGARVLAMGNVGVAGRDDDVLFFNPAQLVVARGTSMALSRMSQVARGATMSTVLRLGPAGIGFGVNYLEYQTPGLTYPITRDDILDPSLTHGTSVLGSVGYAQVYKGFRLGAAAKYASDVGELDRFSGVYGDLGIAKDFGRYSTGLAVQHVGPSITRSSVEIRPPMTATLGVATSRAVGPLDLLATAAVIVSKEQVAGGFGAEVGWSWISGYSIAARGGLHQPREVGIAGYTAGFGFNADRLSLDFAAELLSRERVSYRAGIRIR